MKLKRSQAALAVLVMLAWLSLPEIVDAQQLGSRGGGGHGAAGYGRGGYGTSGYGGGGHGTSDYRGSGHGGGGYSSGYASYGGNFNAYAARRHDAGGRPLSQSSFQSARQGPSNGKPNDYEFSRQNGMNLASNTPLQRATLTRQNAFFDKRKFGGREFNLGWLDHFGNRYGYRWHRSIFWPYFFGDYFSYILWPHGYFNTFWGYGLDVVLLSAFSPYGQLVYDEPEENNSAYSGDLYYNGGVCLPDRSRDRSVEILAPSETCSGFAPGVSDLPIQQLEKIIDATSDQRVALSDLKAATAKASDILKHSCSSETPLTPVSRLAAMQRRLKAMAEANEVVKAPLIHLYGLFSEAQKQHLEASAQPDARQVRALHAKDMNVGKICSEQAEFTNVPADQIASTIQLSEAQKQELEKFKALSEKASAGLKASCPSSVPDTIQGRLDAAQMRVAALSQAIEAPALDQSQE